MTAVYFRVMHHETNEPTGYIGFAMARSNEELLWAIDEFCDPYSVQVKTAHKFCVCVRVAGPDSEGEDQDPPYSELELTDRFPDRDDGDGWRTPAWCKK